MVAQATVSDIGERRKSVRSERKYRQARTEYTKARTNYVNWLTSPEREEEKRERQNQRREEREDREAARRRSRRIQGLSRRSNRAWRTLRRNSKKVLLAELIAAMIITAAYEIMVQKEAPKPSNFIAIFVVYLMLSILAQFGDDWARLAAAFGGLFILAILLIAPQGQKPKGIIFQYLSDFLTGKIGKKQDQQNIPSPPVQNLPVQGKQIAFTQQVSP